MQKTVLPYGTWPSRLSVHDLVQGTNRIGQIQVEGRYLYWIESRPADKGRTTIMRARLKESINLDAPAPYPSSSGASWFEEGEEILAKEWSIGSRVHEYGGGALLVSHERIFFINQADQQIYELNQDGSVHQITQADMYRFADLVLDPYRNRLICVAEYHPLTGSGQHAHPENFLVSIPLSETADKPVNEIYRLVQGDDFYAYPRLSHDGNKLCWISWNLPYMPWEETILWMATITAEEGLLAKHEKLAGGNQTAVFQPGWLHDDTLAFIWDKTGYSNLYHYDLQQETYENLTPESADYSLPLWILGMKTWSEDGLGNIYAKSISGGSVNLVQILPNRKQKLSVMLWAKDLEQLYSCGPLLCGRAEFSDQPYGITSLNPETGDFQINRQSSEFKWPAEELAHAQQCIFLAADGETQLSGYYYAPVNHSYQASDDDLPPVILSAHGGPTANASSGFDLRVQYWTNRGFAFFDVDYSGSTGYSRKFIERLNGHWGIRDVEDMESAARFLVEQRLGDPNKLVIRGSSAGGFTVLMTLAKSDLFAAGVSWYGIGDLNQLAATTHKFEAGYIDTLTGASSKNHEQRLKELSPLTYADQITSPLLILQGGKDMVVPPSQADMIVKAMKARGTPVYRLDFPLEGHGFRQADTLVSAFNTEYAFYAHHLGLDTGASNIFPGKL